MSTLLTEPLSRIEFGDVVSFCETRQKEHVRLDYKREIPKDLSKYVASFANTQGGHLIIGVDEDVDNDGLPELNPEGYALGNEPRQTIRNRIRDIWPPVNIETSDFLSNPKDGSRGFLVVRVPQSDQVPHTVDGRKGIYVRVLDSSIPVAADINQIDFMLRQNDRAKDFQRTQKETLLGRLSRAIQGEPKRGLLRIVAGPRISTTQQLDIQSLSGRAAAIFGLGNLQDTTDYVLRDQLASSSHQSIGWYSRKFNLGMNFDCFGNVAMAEMINEKKPISEFWRGDLANHKDKLASAAAEIEIASTGMVGARVLACVTAMVNYHRIVEFNGPIDVHCLVQNSLGIWLAHWTNMGWRLLADSEAQSNIDFTTQIDILDYSLSPFLLALPILEDLVWAWGHPHKSAGIAMGQAALHILKQEKECAICRAPAILGLEKCFECHSKEQAKATNKG